MRKIDLYDGKYTIINELETGGSFRALRYGEEWRNLAGDNLVLALFQELEEAKEEVKKLQQENFTMSHVMYSEDCAKERILLENEQLKKSRLTPDKNLINAFQSILEAIESINNRLDTVQDEVQSQAYTVRDSDLIYGIRECLDKLKEQL